jgi:hypothetical protein
MPRIAAALYPMAAAMLILGRGEGPVGMAVGLHWIYNASTSDLHSIYTQCTLIDIFRLECRSMSMNVEDLGVVAMTLSRYRCVNKIPAWKP